MNTPDQEMANKILTLLQVWQALGDSEFFVAEFRAKIVAELESIIFDEQDPYKPQLVIPEVKVHG